MALVMACPRLLSAQQVVLQPDPTPVLQPAGLQGLLAPTYDRVFGLALPIGATVTLASDRLILEPRLTYRSRLGTIDPSVQLLMGAPNGIRFEGYAGRGQRTNDAWNYSDLVNSALTLFDGLDTRNYFRSNGGVGRLFGRIDRPGLVLEPFIGGRYEQVSAIAATGNVWSALGKTDVERIRRVNPLVDDGAIGSALIGAQMHDTSGVVLSRGRVELEQSVSTFSGTTNFTQLTVDARVEFPTFKTQRLHFRAHAIATRGDSVPRARYGYLGGSGTLRVVELEALGGSELLFLETRYLIPIDAVLLPVIGIPVLTLRHAMGAAGVSTLPNLEQEIGAGLGLSALHLDVSTDVARKRGTKVSLGISLD